MTNLRNHSDKWLNAKAEASLARFEAVHGVIPIVSAGRTAGEQQALINRWDKGGKANRPPYLYSPARPAATSNHVKGGGLAIDSSGLGIALLHKYGEEFGWFFNYAYDVVHFEYNESRDKHKGVTAVAAGGKLVGFNPTIASRQQYMNLHGKQSLIVDGISGPKTKAAIKQYQSLLRKYGYKGAIDGVWGSGTEAANKNYDAALRGKK